MPRPGACRYLFSSLTVHEPLLRDLQQFAMANTAKPPITASALRSRDGATSNAPEDKPLCVVVSNNPAYEDDLW